MGSSHRGKACIYSKPLPFLHITEFSTLDGGNLVRWHLEGLRNAGYFLLFNCKFIQHFLQRDPRAFNFLSRAGRIEKYSAKYAQ
jgi:hypothetical protein